MTSQDQKTLDLPDGRRLGFAEWGDPQGRPVLVFHGWPGSRLVGRALEGAASKTRVRLITPDRPGMGLSDFQPGRHLIDWPADVLALADQLELGSFSVVGVSGGAPYAQACAHASADRLDRVAVVSGLGPLDTPEAMALMPAPSRAVFAAVRRAGDLTRLPLGFLSLGIQHFPTLIAKQVVAAAPREDRQLLSDPTIFHALQAELEEAFRQGPDGAAHEVGINASPWGFDLAKINQPILLLHGTEDRNVPPALARQVASQLPQCDARFLPDRGHFWYLKHFDEVLAEL